MLLYFLFLLSYYLEFLCQSHHDLFLAHSDVGFRVFSGFKMVEGIESILHHVLCPFPLEQMRHSRPLLPALVRPLNQLKILK